MAGDESVAVDLAIRTLAYLKACDPYYPKSGGEDGEAYLGVVAPYWAPQARMAGY